MRKRVLLVSMPFGTLERPALGISQLKAALHEIDVKCDLNYLNFAFAEFIGHDDYQWITNEVPYTAFAGDWAFTAALYGERPHSDREYVQQILRDIWRLSETDIERIRRIAATVPRFLEHCMQAIKWSDYALVGFTSTFEQNIASLALAAKINSQYPQIIVVFGGANWEGEMGSELHRQFPFVDFVCSGEADVSFPALVRRIMQGRSAGRLRGVIHRQRGKTVFNGQADVVIHMDGLPVPDFSDYFETVAQSTIGAHVFPTLLLETSRGCWWGAKSHCTFCGLNGSTMAFRSKSAARALDELTSLVKTWKTETVECVDNILDMRYFNDMLPALAESNLSVQMFYEVKANLSSSQVAMLSCAGVRRIQPGIESLSDHVLKLMRKGTTALRNIQLLKWCRTYDVHVDWNILYGFPGETRQDYQEIMTYLPAVRFLQPPCACGPVRLDRFSPYFNAPQEFGMINIRPMTAYRFLYPFPPKSLRKIAYYFDYDYAPTVDPRGYADEVIAWVEHWRQNPERGTLASLMCKDGARVLVDTRSDASVPTLLLTGLEKAAYEFCDSVRSGKAVVQHLREEFPAVQFTDRQVIEFLDSLVANRLMVSDGTDYLSLAVPTRLPAKTRPLKNTASSGDRKSPTALTAASAGLVAADLI